MASDFTLTELVDLALCSPEIGAVNFNILRVVLLQLVGEVGGDNIYPQLDDVTANQIQNFKNYLQGAGTSSPMPGVLRYNAPRFQQSSKTPRTERRPQEKAEAAVTGGVPSSTVAPSQQVKAPGYTQPQAPNQQVQDGAQGQAGGTQGQLGQAAHQGQGGSAAQGQGGGQDGQGQVGGQGQAGATGAAGQGGPAGASWQGGGAGAGTQGQGGVGGGQGQAVGTGGQQGQTGGAGAQGQEGGAGTEGQGGVAGGQGQGRGTGGQGQTGGAGGQGQTGGAGAQGQKGELGGQGQAMAQSMVGAQGQAGEQQEGSGLPAPSGFATTESVKVDPKKQGLQARVEAAEAAIRKMSTSIEYLGKELNNVKKERKQEGESSSQGQAMQQSAAGAQGQTGQQGQGGPGAQGQGGGQGGQVQVGGEGQSGAANQAGITGASGTEGQGGIAEGQAQAGGAGGQAQAGGAGGQEQTGGAGAQGHEGEFGSQGQAVRQSVTGAQGQAGQQLEGGALPVPPRSSTAESTKVDPKTQALQARVEAAEAAIRKMGNLIEDLAKGLKNVKKERKQSGESGSHGQALRQSVAGAQGHAGEQEGSTLPVPPRPSTAESTKVAPKTQARVEAAEAAIQKMGNLIEDLAKELKNVKDRKPSQVQVKQGDGVASKKAVDILKLNQESIEEQLVKLDALVQKIPMEHLDLLQKIPVANLELMAAVDKSKSRLGASVQQELQNALLGKKEGGLSSEDLETIFANLNSLLGDADESRDRIEQLYDIVQHLESVVVTKPMLVDAMSDKADKGQMNTKVSYDEFGNAIDEIGNKLQNLLIEVYQKNEAWKRITDQLIDEMGDKLDKYEIGPLRAYFKSHLGDLESQVAALVKQFNEPDPAGTRKKLLRDYNCISCDRHCNISGMTNTPLLPCLAPSRAGQSNASRRAYDLYNMRNAQKADQGCDFNAMERSGAIGRVSLSPQVKSLRDSEVSHLVNRYTGGSHTAISNAARISAMSKRPSTAYQVHPGTSGRVSAAPPPTAAPIPSQEQSDTALAQEGETEAEFESVEPEGWGMPMEGMEE